MTPSVAPAEQRHRTPLREGSGNWAGFTRGDDGARYLQAVSAGASSPAGAQAGAAQLTIRCLDDNTSVFFRFPGREMGDKGAQREIVYQVDDRAQDILELERGKDHAMLGAWQGYRAVPFIRRLLDGVSLKVSALAADGSELPARFAIDGLAEAITELRAACHW